ncbi:MAG: tail fiber domain-containing protein [Acidobacteria bacterium]|nr:tail fiber domain-containing protein [Acidobacteriota bacterium]
MSNTTGIGNSMFGVFAGLNNAAGSGNSFFGYFAGQDNTSGSGNSFFGNGAGLMNMTGANNTMIGAGADVGANNLTYATAIGADAVASQSNSIFLGRADGSDAVRIPGSTVIGGTLVVNTLGSAGSTTVCLNAANRFAPCSSSLRYKTDVRAFTGGLEIVRRLRPVSFKWIDGGASDVGFGAEDVANIEPLLTTRNDRGEIEGVKYPQISTVLVNAVNEQQTEIEQLKEQVRLQQRQLEEQSRQIEALKSLVCALAPAADCSKEPKPR